MKQNWYLALLLFLFGLGSCSAPTADRGPTFFSFHLFIEPQHLDPSRSHASSAGYFFNNTLSGLYKINQNNELQEEGGRCQWEGKLKLVCTLQKTLWSNGNPVVAADYVRSFHRLIDPKNAAPRAYLLKFVKNAREITKGQQPVESLGIKAESPSTFSLSFYEKDREFLYKLSSTALYPLPKNQVTDRKQYKKFLANGPYLVDSWNWGKQLNLKPNPYYNRGHKNRPAVRVHFIDDEMTAFRLYEKHKLSFLRRIPSQLIPLLKSREDFFQVPMLRFDYIGFGKALLDQPLLRKAMVHAIDYENLKVVLGGLERPGCPSIPKTWFIKQKCYDYDIEQAKKILIDVPTKAIERSYDFKVSHLGGNDIKKAAEFIEHQWKKNLGLNIQVGQVDSKVFINQLRKDPYDIFRKGVGLDRPTCYNAMETFTTDSLRNYLKIDDESYKKILSEMKNLSNQSQEYKKLCQEAMQHLLDLNHIIPLGEMHFTLMASPKFSGWSINGLNQLDLSQLHPTP